MAIFHVFKLKSMWYIPQQKDWPILPFKISALQLDIFREGFLLLSSCSRNPDRRLYHASLWSGAVFWGYAWYLWHNLALIEDWGKVDINFSWARNSHWYQEGQDFTWRDLPSASVEQDQVHDQPGDLRYDSDFSYTHAPTQCGGRPKWRLEKPGHSTTQAQLKGDLKLSTINCLWHWNLHFS